VLQFRRPILRDGVLLGAACLLPSMALAIAVEFPAPASTTATRREPLTSYALPIGPWQDGQVSSRILEGPLEQTAWRLSAPGMTTLQILAPLRDQLTRAGFRILWDCETDACGGFDFRYAIDVMPEPDMHVDLGDFRFLSAERMGAAGPEAVSLLVSRSAETGFVQIVSVGAALEVTGPLAPAEQAAPVAPPEEAGPVLPPSSLAAALQGNGSVVLEDLVFKSGSAELGPGPYETLVALAAFLKDDPARTVALVGHTDASGGLAGNTALSRARAASVRERLMADYAVPAAQIMAEGVGYLAPRATNRTEDGRARNRRVEAILTSTR
jgi:outer membrane protein OmpA-like peptidoglycan-associated protein